MPPRQRHRCGRWSRRWRVGLALAPASSPHRFNPTLVLSDTKVERDFISCTQPQQLPRLAHAKRHRHRDHVIGDGLVADDDRTPILLQFANHAARRISACGVIKSMPASAASPAEAEGDSNQKPITEKRHSVKPVNPACERCGRLCSSPLPCTSRRRRVRPSPGPRRRSGAWPSFPSSLPRLPWPAWQRASSCSRRPAS